MKIHFLVCLLVFILPLFCDSAATAGDDFNISTVIGSDNNPPTVPNPVTVSVVSPNQIDVFWATSTDAETSVAGYQLFRDLVQIATTTSLFFNDVGLVASTTYSYTVVAFDVFSNFSSSTTPIATSTFALPVATTTATTSDSNNATRVKVEIKNLEIVPGTNNTKINFSLTRPARYVLRYGQTLDYASGLVETNVLRENHQTLLQELEGGTVYNYELTILDGYGRVQEVRTGTFQTLSEPDTSLPPNVTGFNADIVNNDVLLSWQTPVVSDFAYVRLVRNHLFYPLDPNDGFVVFEGSLSEFLDQGAFAQYGVQYYTIFTYDTSGNVSSGAVAFVVNSQQSIEEVEDIFSGSSTDSIAPGLELGMSDVVVEQNDKVMFANSAGVVEIHNNNPFSIKIDYDLFPRHLKVITVTLRHPTDKRKFFSFILKADKDFQYYQATIDSLGQPGAYDMSVHLFDVERDYQTVFSGVLNVTGLQKTSKDTQRSIDWMSVFLVFISIAVLIWLANYILLHRRKD